MPTSYSTLTCVILFIETFRDCHGKPRLFEHDVNLYGLPFQTKSMLKLMAISINNHYRVGKELLKSENVSKYWTLFGLKSLNNMKTRYQIQ